MPWKPARPQLPRVIGPTGRSPRPRRRSHVATVAVGFTLALAASIGVGRPTESVAAATCTTTVNPGSSIQSRVDGAASGAVICVKAGTYGRFTVRRSNLTVQAYPGHQVTITGGSAAWQAGVRVDNASGVTIRGLTVRGNSLGVFLVDARRAVITGNHITDNAYGIEVHGATDGTVISANSIRDNDRYLDASRSAGGINLYKTRGGIDIRWNKIFGNDQVAVEIYGASDVLIRNNEMNGSNDMIETGTDSSHRCDRLRVLANTFSAAALGGRMERGIYLRCASYASVKDNVFRSLDRFAIGLYAGGDFAGPLHDVAIARNTVTNGRAFSIDSTLPSSITIDHDRLGRCTAGTCPAEGNMLAYVAGKGNTTSISTLRSWTRYEDNGVQTN